LVTTPPPQTAKILAKRKGVIKRRGLELGDQKTGGHLHNVRDQKKVSVRKGRSHPKRKEKKAAPRMEEVEREKNRK